MKILWEYSKELLWQRGLPRQCSPLLPRPRSAFVFSYGAASSTSSCYSFKVRTKIVNWKSLCLVHGYLGKSETPVHKLYIHSLRSKQSAFPTLAWVSLGDLHFPINGVGYHGNGAEIYSEVILLALAAASDSLSDDNATAQKTSLEESLAGPKKPAGEQFKSHLTASLAGYTNKPCAQAVGRRRSWKWWYLQRTS